MDDSFYMREALRLAEEAAADGEVPVGAAVVRGGEIVGRGRNRRETKKTPEGVRYRHERRPEHWTN